jgi:hypothetical protein
LIAQWFYLHTLQLTASFRLSVLMIKIQMTSRKPTLFTVYDVSAAIEDGRKR